MDPTSRSGSWARSVSVLGEPLWTPAQVSDYLQVPVQTLYQWRLHNRGPRAHRIGKHLRYPVAEITSWLAEQSDSTPAAS